MSGKVYGAAANRAPLQALYVANAVSIVGNFMTLVALPWFILELTGSAMKTGLTLLAVTFPQVLAGFFGNAFIDRLGFRRTSVLADLTAGATIALVPVLYHSKVLPFGLLLLLVFGGNLLNAPGTTARQSILPDLIALAEVPAVRANSWYQAIVNFAQLAGPLLAGLAIPLLGASNVLWLDAGSFAVSALAVALFVPVPHREAQRSGVSHLAQVREGLRFLTGDRLLLTLTVTSAVTSFTGPAYFSLLLPIYAREEYGSALALGLLRGGWGAGALLGSLAYALIAGRLPRRVTFGLAFIACGALMVPLLWGPPLAVSVVAIVASAVAFGPVNPLRMTVQQERTPVALRSRVFGTSNAVALLAAPLGFLFFGNLVVTQGIIVAVGVDLCVFGGVALAIWLLPAYRQMEAPDAELAMA